MQAGNGAYADVIRTFIDGGVTHPAVGITEYDPQLEEVGSPETETKDLAGPLRAAIRARRVPGHAPGLVAAADLRSRRAASFDDRVHAGSLAPRAPAVVP